MLHLRYTAREGGSALRKLVESGLRDLLGQIVLEAGRTGLYQAYSVCQRSRTPGGSCSSRAAPDHRGDRAPAVCQPRAHPDRRRRHLVRPVAGNPASYPATIGGAAVTLNRDDTLKQCTGSTAPPVLGTAITIAGDPAALEDLTLLIHYKLTK